VKPSTVALLTVAVAICSLIAVGACLVAHI
jgi:hypothetical protein